MCNYINGRTAFRTRTWAIYV